MIKKNEAPRTYARGIRPFLRGSGIPRSRKGSIYTTSLCSWFSAKGDKKYIPAVLFLVVLAIAQKAGAQGIQLPNVGLPSASLASVIEGVARWLLGIFGFLAIISFIISGTMYFLAVGDEAEMKKAKHQMYWSIMGVVVGIMGLVIIMAVDQMLRGSGLG